MTEYVGLISLQLVAVNGIECMIHWVHTEHSCACLPEPGLALMSSQRSFRSICKGPQDRCLASGYLCPEVLQHTSFVSLQSLAAGRDSSMTATVLQWAAQAHSNAHESHFLLTGVACC